MSRTNLLLKLNGSLSLLAVALIGFSPAWAQNPQPWTAVGSSGSVNPASLSVVQFGNPIPQFFDAPPDDIGAITIQSNAFGTHNIRYNVVSVPGILGTNGLALTARYLDPGSGDRVVVRFKRYNLATGATATILTLDSDAFPTSANFQVQSVATDICTGAPPTLNFVENSYFMDVELTHGQPRRAAVSASFLAPRPALGMIRLDSVFICLS